MSERTFRLIFNGKKLGLFKGSSPSSAAKKAYKKLSDEQMKNSSGFHQLSLKDKVLKTEPGKTSFKFELQETTKDSKKKVYGPYKGSFVKDKLNVKMAGGRQESQNDNSRPQQHIIIPTNEARAFIINMYGEDIYNRALEYLRLHHPNLAGSNTDMFIIALNSIAENIIIPQNVDRAFREARNSIPNRPATDPRISRAARRSSAIGAARAANAARIASAAFDDRAVRAARGPQSNNLFNPRNITNAFDLSHPRPRRGNPNLNFNPENNDDDRIVFINSNPNPNPNP
jgi:hypothetical protein